MNEKSGREKDKRKNKMDHHKFKKQRRKKVEKKNGWKVKKDGFMGKSGGRKIMKG